MSTSLSLDATPQRTVNRWIQLVAGIIAMAAIANLQYAWTLFTGPLTRNLHASLAAVQVSVCRFRFDGNVVGNRLKATWSIALVRGPCCFSAECWWGQAGLAPAWRPMSRDLFFGMRWAASARVSSTEPPSATR